MWQQIAIALASQYEPGTADRMAQAVLAQAEEEAQRPQGRGIRIKLADKPGTADTEWMLRAREYARGVSQPG